MFHARGRWRDHPQDNFASIVAARALAKRLLRLLKRQYRRQTRPQYSGVNQLPNLDELGTVGLDDEKDAAHVIFFRLVRRRRRGQRLLLPSGF